MIQTKRGLYCGSPQLIPIAKLGTACPARVANSEHYKDRRAAAVIYKKKTSDVYLKSFIKNGDANANERWLRRRNIYVPPRSAFRPLLSHNVAIEREQRASLLELCRA